MNKILKSIAAGIMAGLIAVSFSIPSVSAKTKPIDTSKEVNLKWFVIGNGQPEDMSIVLKSVNTYLKKKINAKLDLTIFTWGDDFENKMNARIASGANFDMTFTSSWALNYSQNARIGAFTDLTDMMDTYAPKTKALLGPDVIKGASVDGRLYAIPSYGCMATSYGLLINKNLAKKYNINLTKIKKLEDLEPALKAIKSKDGSITAFRPTENSGAFDTLNFKRIIDSNIPVSIIGDGKSKKVINDLETPQALSLFKLMNKWYKAGYIPKIADVRNMTDEFNPQSGKVFSYVTNLSPTKELSNFGISWQAINLTPGYISTENCNIIMQAVSATSQNPERALMFLELMNNDKYLSNLINFGIEGTHYKKVKSNVIDSISPDCDRYNPGTSWMFGNNTIVYNLPSEDPNRWKTSEAWNKSAIRSSILGFYYDNSKTKTAIASVSEILRGYMNDLLVGKSDAQTTLTKLNKELNAGGLDRLIEDAQKQIDNYK